ncbi:MAG: geranylgeranyl reductase family protein [Deltaproteobacteria bacterium]|nr:geranylgeranyl reductase family protein [Deltaproteobacteria bacterium]
MYDLAIVGGGPAGSSAGRTAALRGLRTLILEKTHFPRYKACAGGLSLRILRHLDFSLPPELCEKNITGGFIHIRGRKLEGRGKMPLATMVTRSAFDAFLLEKAREAGAEIRMGQRVIDVEERGNCVELSTTGGACRARFVVIAEGAQGRLKERVRRRDRRNEYGICLVTEISERNDVIDDRLPGMVEIHFDAVSNGYGWIFPHDGYYSVGIGSLAAILPRPQRTMAGFLHDRGFESACRVRGHVIPAGGIRRRVVRSRVMLCGDAAGFVDPLTGEGLPYAIRSGQIAASVAADTLAGSGEPGPARRYERLCRGEFGGNLRYALLSAKIIYGTPSLFYRVLTGTAGSLEKYLETSLEEGQYASYLRWLVPRLPARIFSRGR